MLYALIAGIASALIAIGIAVCCLRVVVVQEATAVAFKYLGRFCYCAMAFANHHFDFDGFVQDGYGSNSYGRCWCIWRIGGLVFYLRPFVKPVVYTDQNSPDGFGHDIYVHLNDITPEPVTTAAETAAPENVALNVKFVSTMRVVNPYRWLFPSPKDVNNQVVKRQDAVLRAWVRSGNQEHAQAARGDGEQLWRDLIAQGCIPIFAQIEENWGLLVLEKSIIVEDVGYDPEYQAALKAASQAELQAKASVAQTAGRISLAVATELGMTPDELKQKLASEPDFRNTPAYKEALVFAKDMVKRDRAADAGELTDIRIGNSDGTSMSGELSGLAAVAALFGGRGGGRGGGQRSGGQYKGGGQGSPKDDEIVPPLE
jgi:hypothetical protein